MGEGLEEWARRLPPDVVPTNIEGAYARTGGGRIVPKLGVEPGRTRDMRAFMRTRRRTRSVFRFTAGGFVNNLWSGVWIGGEWDRIEGTWTIPVVSAPPEPPGGDGLYWMYSWIGLDGAGTHELLQIGIDQRVHPDGSVECHPWYEWVADPDPNNPKYVSYTPIETVDVRPGDQVSCSVSYWSILNKRIGGIIQMTNLTRGGSFELFLWPPPKAPMAGTTAEWIVECPGTGYPAFALAQFTEVKFTSARVSGPDNAEGLPSHGNIENIANVAGVVVTSVEIPGPAKDPQDWLRIRHYNDGVCQRLRNLCQTTRARLGLV